MHTASAALPTDDALNGALELLSKLMSARVAPDRVASAIGAMVSGWALEPDMNPAAAQHRIGALWDSVSKDAADLQEQIADAEGESPQAAADAHRTLATMNAIVAALAAVNDRL